MFTQFIGQRPPIDRAYHVWHERPDGKFKCVLCGGVVRTPNCNQTVDTYEPLTDEERKLCPLRR